MHSTVVLPFLPVTKADWHTIAVYSLCPDTLRRLSCQALSQRSLSWEGK